MSTSGTPVSVDPGTPDPTGLAESPGTTATPDQSEASDAPDPSDATGGPASTAATDPPAHPTDEVLIRRAVLGDRAAFAVIVEKHGAGMFRYAMRMLDGDHHAAEDAVQDALIDAWVNLPSFRQESSLRTWLFRITANRVLASRRRHRPVVVDDQLLSATPEPDHTGPPAEVQHGELWATLELALGELPWRQRASWLLREMEGLSYDDIASILNTTPTVVRGQLHRARRSLAIRMEQWR